MGRYPGDPEKLRVIGLESRQHRNRLGPGPVTVAGRRFWADEVEVVIRVALPAVWEAGGQQARPGRRP